MAEAGLCSWRNEVPKPIDSVSEIILDHQAQISGHHTDEWSQVISEKISRNITQLTPAQIANLLNCVQLKTVVVLP